jgi:hypothetical protein
LADINQRIRLFRSSSARLSRYHKIRPQIPDYKINCYYSVGFEVKMIVTMKSTIFQDMKLELRWKLANDSEERGRLNFAQVPEELAVFTFRLEYILNKEQERSS